MDITVIKELARLELHAGYAIFKSAERPANDLPCLCLRAASLPSENRNNLSQNAELCPSECFIDGLMEGEAAQAGIIAGSKSITLYT